MNKMLLGLTTALALIASAAVSSADPVKVGMITTLSGGGASLGIDVRDGFQLAIK
ncbi:MAG: ABC transporter substrate-binding protein, partial [Hoeflea sp.]|nr:ABC transporter substrate-binding protein [Hoeflea sp.]